MRRTHVHRDDIHEAFLTLACAIICWPRTAEPSHFVRTAKAPTAAIRMAINPQAMTISACGCELRPGKHSVITCPKTPPSRGLRQRLGSWTIRC
jgi:hypothetical protein